METKRKSRYHFTKEEVKQALFDFNTLPNVFPSPLPDKVSIWDETLRDGEQTPGVFLTLDEKIKIATALDEIGTAKIAVGFPAISKNELDIVKSIHNLGLSHADVLGIARPRESDIDACLQSDLDEIVLFMPISDLMMKILHETPESELATMQHAFDYARDHGLRFNWVSEDCTRAQPQQILDVFQLAVDNGTECIVVGDTVGVLQPESTIHLIEYIKRELSWDPQKIALGIHTHNDFGQATSNTCVGVYHGVTFPHVCVNGYGERAGNAAFEEVVVNLERMGIQTGIKLEKLTELSELVEKIFTLPLSVHKPIVGNNAFSHESGLHINAIISHPISYEPINPQLVGQKRQFYLGKFSGSGSIVNAIETKLKGFDINLPKEVISQILQDVKNLHEASSKEENTLLFAQTKDLFLRLRQGITDTEFFKIVQARAGEYLKESGYQLSIKEEA